MSTYDAQFTAPPITVPVNDSSAVRIATLVPPYTIINLSTEGTAWLADNPGVRVNYGTPLYPGTSLQWNRVGELWAIGDSDFLIQASKDVLDWEPNPIAIATAILNSGVLVIDNPVTVFDGQLNANNSTPRIDTSRYQSVIFTITPLSGPTFLSPDSILIFFNASPGILSGIDRQITFISPVTYSVTMPIIGAGLMVTAGPGNFDLTITLSHRQYPMIQTIGNPSVFNNLNTILFVTDQLIATGATASLDGGIPWFGEVELAVYANNGAVAPGTNIFIGDPNVGGNIYKTSMTAVGTGTIAACQFRYVMTGVALRVAVNNLTGADRTYQVVVKPVWTSAGAF
jgi:hypothetical protein